MLLIGGNGGIPAEPTLPLQCLNRLYFCKEKKKKKKSYLLNEQFNDNSSLTGRGGRVVGVMCRLFIKSDRNGSFALNPMHTTASYCHKQKVHYWKWLNVSAVLSRPETLKLILHTPNSFVVLWSTTFENSLPRKHSWRYTDSEAAHIAWWSANTLFHVVVSAPPLPPPFQRVVVNSPAHFWQSDIVFLIMVVAQSLSQQFMIPALVLWVSLCTKIHKKYINKREWLIFSPFVLKRQARVFSHNLRIHALALWALCVPK